jgi:hypothetical protein
MVPLPRLQPAARVEECVASLVDNLILLQLHFVSEGFANRCRLYHTYIVCMWCMYQAVSHIYSVHVVHVSHIYSVHVVHVSQRHASMLIAIYSTQVLLSGALQKYCMSAAGALRKHSISTAEHYRSTA